MFKWPITADCVTAVEAPTGSRWQIVRVGHSRSVVSKSDANAIPFLSLSLWLWLSRLHGEAEAQAARHEELRGSHVSRSTLTSVIRPLRNPIQRRSMPPRWQRLRRRGVKTGGGGGTGGIGGRGR